MPLADQPKKLVKPIKWHGGKEYLADWIVSHLPPHLHYVEPFCGGASVLLRRDPNRNWMAADDGHLPSYLKGSSEVINDVDGELMNFWQVIGSPKLFPKFSRRVEATPFSQPGIRDRQIRLNGQFHSSSVPGSHVRA